MDRIRSTLSAIPRAALYIGLVGLVVRVALVAATDDYVPQDDALDYDRHARSIADGNGYPNAVFVVEPSPTALRPPLWPYVLAATYKLAPGTTTAGRLLCALLGAIAVLLLFLIADRLWGRRVALTASAMAAVFPPLVVLSGGLLVESVFIPLELAFVMALLAYGRSGGLRRWAVVAGVFMGLCWLARANGFVLAIPLLVALYAIARRDGGPRLAALRRVLVPATAGLAATALVVAPWTIRNAVEFDGKLIPVSDSGGYGLVGTYSDVAKNDPDAKWEWHAPEHDPSLAPIFLDRDHDEADTFNELGDVARDYIKDHPGAVGEALLYNSTRLLYPEFSPVLTERSYNAMGVPHKLRELTTWSYIVVALIAIVGAVLAFRRRELGPLWLWLVPVLLALSFASLSGEPRYRTMMDPFILVLAAYALVRLAERVGWLGEAAAGQRPQHAHPVE